jgi:hypothetical protein
MIRVSRILLWIGGAIGISVGAAWAMVLNHAHPQYVQRTELESLVREIQTMQQDVRDLKSDMSNQMRLLLDRLTDGNSR